VFSVPHTGCRVLVSRRRYESLVAQNQRNLDRLDSVLGENERLLTMVNGLFEKYHALRTTGANPVPEPRTVEAKEPDAVQWAINERAGGNTALRAHLTRWAERERRNNMEPEQIIQRLTVWHTESDDE